MYASYLISEQLYQLYECRYDSKCSSIITYMTIYDIGLLQRQLGEMVASLHLYFPDYKVSTHDVINQVKYSIMTPCHDPL